MSLDGVSPFLKVFVLELLFTSIGPYLHLHWRPFSLEESRPSYSRSSYYQLRRVFLNCQQMTYQRPSTATASVPSYTATNRLCLRLLIYSLIAALPAFHRPASIAPSSALHLSRVVSFLGGCGHK